MPKEILSERHRKDTISISIPRYIKEKLEEIGNYSELVTQILEENIDRITEGDLDEAIRYREARIRNEVLEVLNANRKVISEDDKISQLVEALKDFEVDKIISELKSLRKVHRNTLVRQIEGAIKVCQKELKEL